MTSDMLECYVMVMEGKPAKKPNTEARENCTKYKRLIKKAAMCRNMLSCGGSTTLYCCGMSFEVKLHFRSHWHEWCVVI